jgi:hypothetical protein
MTPGGKRAALAIGLSLILLAAHLSFAGEGMAVLRVTPVARDAITLDGIPDEAAWEAANWSERRFTVFRSDEASAVSTRFAVLAGPERLFVAVRAEEPLANQLKAEETTRDKGAVWMDDCIELLLAWEGRSGPFVHLIVNPLGTQLDEIGRPGFGNDRTWDGDWQSAAARNKAGWTLEVAIPYKTLAPSAGPSGIWAANICRVRRAGGTQEYSSWSPAEKSFSNTAEFGLLLFGDALAGPRQASRREIDAVLAELERAPGNPGKAFAAEIGALRALRARIADPATGDSELVDAMNDATGRIEDLRVWIAVEAVLQDLFE